MATPFFDFGETNKPKNKNIKIYPMIVDLNKNPKKSENDTTSWASIAKNGKPKQKKNQIYLYDREVDELCKKMNWGDFECMMDDVIVVPEGEKKPNHRL